MIVGTGDWKGLRTCVVRKDTFFRNGLRAFLFPILIYFVNFLFFQDAANSFGENFSATEPDKVPFYALNFQ